MSLDGYYEGTNKNVMPLFDYRRESYPTDESFDAYNAERLRAADTLLLGRTTYDGFKNFWPPVADDPQFTPIQREISRLNNAIEKVVISNSLTPEETTWHNTRIVGRDDAYTAITELKSGAGRDILVFGSRTLWNDLLAHNLVDELHLMIAPVLVGAGTPALDRHEGASLRLIDIRTAEGSGNILARYAVGSA